MSTTPETLTVEEALKELEAMFGHGVYISVEAKGVRYPSDYGEEPPLLTAHINVDHRPFFASTLNGCMAHIRAWKESQQGKDGNKDEK